MRNVVLNEKLQQLTLPTHRSMVTDAFSNLDWLKKHITKSNNPDAETMRLLHMNQKELRLPYLNPEAQ